MSRIWHDHLLCSSHCLPRTENTGMIAGLGKAAELVCKHIGDYHHHMETVRDYLEQQLEVS